MADQQLASGYSVPSIDDLRTLFSNTEASSGEVDEFSLAPGQSSYSFGLM
jgi:hypothetical protein